MLLCHFAADNDSKNLSREQQGNGGLRKLCQLLLCPVTSCSNQAGRAVYFYLQHCFFLQLINILPCLFFACTALLRNLLQAAWQNMPRRGSKSTKATPGGRKHPFSGKQKKEQLQQKRDRRRQQDDVDSPSVLLGAEQGIASVHTSLGRSGQENALSTMFVKELASVVEERKRAASMPICLSGVGTAPVALPSPDTSLPFPLPPAVAHAAASGAHTAAAGRSFMHEYDDVLAQAAFASWLRSTFAAFPSWAMNKFEVNLNVWKQLWHTLQHSTHLVFVADARNPLFHVHYHLYDVCSRVLRKPLILLLNKSELVPADTLARWVKYLQAALPQCSAVVPFTAAAAQITFDAKERLAGRRRALREAKKAHDPAHKQARMASAEALMRALQLPGAWPAVRRNVEEASGAQRSNIATVAERLTTQVAPSELTQMALPGGGLLHSASADSDDDSDWGGAARRKGGRKSRKRDKAKRAAAAAAAAAAADESSDSDEDEHGEEDGLEKTEAEADRRASPPAPPLEEELPPYEGPSAVIGMIGYPNVGKSSVINLLLGGKRVSVSRTPGHTKHCQSLPLCGGLQGGAAVSILDCPGLVFPCTLQPGARAAAQGIMHSMAQVHWETEPSTAPQAAVAAAAAVAAGAAAAADGDPVPAEGVMSGGDTLQPEPLLARGSLKLQGPALQVAMQECAGVMPLAQVREPYSAVRFLCEALPMPQLLGIKPEHDTYGHSPSVSSSAGHVGGVAVREEGEGGGTAALSAWSPYGLCEAYAEKKGIRIARTGAPDTHAAGRAILYDTVDGVLPLYWEPPTV